MKFYTVSRTKRDAMRPIMIAITKKLASATPPIAKIPNTERIQRISNTPAISLKGVGRIPIAQATIKRIRTLHNVIGCPFIENKIISGMGSESKRTYPRNQRTINVSINAVIILS
jgi:hypothetical protein